MAHVTLRQALGAAARLGLAWHSVPFTAEQLRVGMQVELEHTDVTHGVLVTTARIALAHLRECASYYERLRPLERACARAESPRRVQAPTKAKTKAKAKAKTNPY